MHRAQPIGRGNYSVVYKAKRNSDGVLVAIKLVRCVVGKETETRGRHTKHLPPRSANADGSRLVAVTVMGYVV